MIWLHQDGFTNWDRRKPFAEGLAFCFGSTAGFTFFDGAAELSPENLRLPIPAVLRASNK
jgi:hypothetical protein